MVWVVLAVCDWVGLVEAGFGLKCYSKYSRKANMDTICFLIIDYKRMISEMHKDMFGKNISSLSHRVLWFVRDY